MVNDLRSLFDFDRVNTLMVVRREINIAKVNDADETNSFNDKPEESETGVSGGFKLQRAVKLPSGRSLIFLDRNWELTSAARCISGAAKRKLFRAVLLGKRRGGTKRREGATRRHG